MKNREHILRMPGRRQAKRILELKIVDILGEQFEKRAYLINMFCKTIAKIAEGMKYLESNGIVHSDLNDRHIMCNRNAQIKIIAIGIRALLAKSNEFSPEWFPFDCWSAPEFEENKKAFSYQSDVWAFGVLGYVIFHRGEMPYKGISEKKLPDYIQNGNYPTSSDENYNKILPVLKFCWHVCPSERYSFKEIHTWLKNRLFLIYQNFPAINDSL